MNRIDTPSVGGRLKARATPIRSATNAIAKARRRSRLGSGHGLGISGTGLHRVVDMGEETWPRVVGMAKPNPRKLPSSASAEALAAQAEEALRLGKFKEAIELYKQLLKQEARPDWRDALAAAYVGRARALSAKGLFKEAEIVLGNAAALDGAVKEPLFLLPAWSGRARSTRRSLRLCSTSGPTLWSRARDACCRS